METDSHWPASVLVVEDESITALDMQSTLMALGYSVPGIAATGEQALILAERHRPDLILMDVNLRGGIDGIETTRQIRRRIDTAVIYVTAYADPDTVRRARQTDPYGYLLKPFDVRELHVVIEMALRRRELEMKLRESERWLAATLRSIGDPVVATDASWKIRFMNPAAEKLTGWSADEATGRELGSVLRVTMTEGPRPPDEDDSSSAARVARSTLLTRDGRRLRIIESSTTIRSDAGKVIGTVIAIRELPARSRRVH
jgi:PAS domain S-box-containing protein